MPKFKIKRKNSSLIIEAKVKDLNPPEAEFVAANFPHGFFKPQITKNKLEFLGPDGISLENFLANPLDRHAFYLLCMQIAAAGKKIAQAGLSVNKLVTDIKYIFVNPVTGELWFMYLPVQQPDVNGDIIILLRAVCYQICSKAKNYPDYVYNFDNFLGMQRGFDYKSIADYVRSQDNAAVAETEKKNKQTGSGFMTNKRKDYYEHYENANGQGPQGAPAPAPAPAQNQPGPAPAPNGAPIVGYDPYTGAPIYGQSGPAPAPAPAPAQPQQIIGYDPYTGEPIYGQPSAQAEPAPAPAPQGLQITGYDIYTGEPIYAPADEENTGLLEENNASYDYNPAPQITGYDPYTGEPIYASAAPAPVPEPAPAPAPAPEGSVITGYDIYTGEPIYATPAPQVQPAPAPTPAPQVQPAPAYTPQPEIYAQPAPSNDYYPDDYGSEETTLLVDDTEETTLLVEEEVSYHCPTLTRVSTGESVYIDKPVFRVGKERSYVDFFISNNPAVSRSHADIICRGGIYYIKDLNSKNRTFINDRAIIPNEECEIHDGDAIRLANEDFTFQE